MNHSGIRGIDQYSGIIKKHKFLLPKNCRAEECQLSHYPYHLKILLLGYACLYVLSKVLGLQRKALGRKYKVLPEAEDIRASQNESKYVSKLLQL